MFHPGNKIRNSGKWTLKKKKNSTIQRFRRRDFLKSQENFPEERERERNNTSETDLLILVSELLITSSSSYLYMAGFLPVA